MNAKRYAVICVLLILSMLFIPIDVSANSPPPNYWYSIQVTNLPEGTAYVDMLIPLSESDQAYTQLVRDNLPKTFSEDAQIVTWHKEGFCSYSLHYHGARSVTKVSDENQVFFFVNDLENWTSEESHMQEIEDLGEMRLAMLDDKGNILQISSTLILRSRNAFAEIDGTFTYDAELDEFSVGHDDHPLYFIAYLLFVIVGLIITCVVEYMITILFGVRKTYGGTVVKVNAVSQLIMHLLHVLFYGVWFWRYEWSVLILEILIYTGELIYYRYRMKEVSFLKCAAYTIIANTTSLICGLLFFNYFDII